MFFGNLFSRGTLWALILASLLASGCSKNLAVTGTVTYSDDGSPVQSGLVVFTGDKEAGRGVIKDGKYSIGLLKNAGGIPPGTYKVSADSYEMPVYNSVDMSGNRLNSSTTTTEQELYYTKDPQTIDVRKSMTYDFTVERGKRPRP